MSKSKFNQDPFLGHQPMRNGNNSGHRNRRPKIPKFDLYELLLSGERLNDAIAATNIQSNEVPTVDRERLSNSSIGHDLELSSQMESVNNESRFGFDELESFKPSSIDMSSISSVRDEGLSSPLLITQSPENVVDGNNMIEGGDEPNYIWGADDMSMNSAGPYYENDNNNMFNSNSLGSPFASSSNGDIEADFFMQENDGSDWATNGWFATPRDFSVPQDAPVKVTEDHCDNFPLNTEEAGEEEVEEEAGEDVEEDIEEEEVEYEDEVEEVVKKNKKGTPQSSQELVLCEDQSEEHTFRRPLEYYRTRHRLNLREILQIIGNVTDGCTYYENPNYVANDAYIAEYVRSLPGETNRFGNCPYCPPSAATFLNHNNSHYMHHLSKSHGVFSDGSIVANPEVVWAMHVAKGKRVEAAVCPDCNELVKIHVPSAKDPDSNRYLEYLRHQQDKHSKGCKKNKKVAAAATAAAATSV